MDTDCPAGQAILTNINDSICVSIRDFPELTENSIYFQDTRCFRVYNLKEKKVCACKYEKWGIKRYYRPILLVWDSCRI